MILRYSHKANLQIEEIFSNDGIYDRFGNFTQQFLMWNSEFHRFVNKNAINKQRLSSKGIYKIGNIGVIAYNYFNLIDTDIFEILEFRFSKLPYKVKRTQYKIIGNGGYGYMIACSLFNEKCAILTPQTKRLCKFVFDDIIGFSHHFGYEKNPTAIGFIGDRVYEIEMDGNVRLLKMSRNEFLEMKIQSESKRKTKPIISESIIINVVAETLNKYIRSIRNRA